MASEPIILIIGNTLENGIKKNIATTSSIDITVNDN